MLALLGKGFELFAGAMQLILALKLSEDLCHRAYGLRTLLRCATYHVPGVRMCDYMIRRYVEYVSPEQI